jgi:UDP-GlcNAc:undecaprenyl-phosphate/decaprenyl-phosphate GlcNAc-1-phosphate transferase
MSYTAGQYILLGLAAFAMSGLLTWPVRKLAIAIGAMDRPNLERKTQKEPVPYLGGVAIAITILVITYASIAANLPTVEKFTLASQVLIPATLLGLMGLVDDLKGLAALPRLVIQTIAAIVMSLILINTETMGFAFGNTTIDTVVSILWIVGICNSINFFDNLDGGAAGTVAAATIGIFFIAFAQSQELISALAILTAGATLGFLIWNKSPAKIYMGDAGALFLGIILSTLTIRMNPGLDPNWKSLAIPLILLAVPILDTTVAVTSRIYRGLTPFNGGKDHLSHRLVRIGFTHRVAAFILWGSSGVCATVAYLIYEYPNEIGSGLILGSSITWLGAMFFFLRIASEDNEPSSRPLNREGL